MKSGIAPTAVEAYQGAVGFPTPPKLPPPEDPPAETDEPPAETDEPPAETDEPPAEIDELVTEPPEETGLCL